jgi:CBS domain-containing protein
MQSTQPHVTLNLEVPMKNNTLSVILDTKGHTLHSIAPDVTVLDAVHAMNTAGIGSLLVMNGDEVVGIFTERDVLRRVVAAELDPKTTKVAKVMTRDLVTVRKTTTVTEAMAVVTEKRCRHLPVVDEDQFLGMVSIGDLTRWVSREQAFHIQDLVNYITGRYPG